MYSTLQHLLRLHFIHSVWDKTLLHVSLAYAMFSLLLWCCGLSLLNALELGEFLIGDLPAAAA